MRLTAAQEDYLKAIWYFGEQQTEVRPSQIGEYLGVKLPTVLSMIKNLADMSLIQYERTSGIKLKPKGKKEALVVIRKHRIIETFLDKTLDLDQNLIHEEAERLEHAISETLIMHLDRFLGYPEFDPHGKEIPLSGEQRPPVDLSEVDEGFFFTVISIPDDFRKKYCESKKFVPGSRWHMKEIGPKDETYMVNNNKTDLAFTGEFAMQVKVRLEKDKERIKEN